ncbi:MAG: erythromycin esterase family protein [Microbacterium sp.]|jgi:erythromycin esterase|nr:erythromycin esterase family protein [Microbacterium sp.]
MIIRLRTILLSTIALLGALALAACATAEPQGLESRVTEWAQHRAVAVPDDLSAPGEDLAEIGDATSGAEVIGLGEPGHGISEVSRLQARYARHLIENEGVRAIAFEMDWTLALGLDDYLRGEHDDIDGALRRQESIWRTAEIRDLLQWIREYNDRHEDDVQIAGTEYFATGLAAYDAVEGYLAANAPERLGELRELFELLRPVGDDAGKHLRAYMKIEDKTPYVEAATAVVRLVTSAGGGADHDIVVHHAEQIRSWYEGFSLPWAEIPRHRDEKAAENVRWWQRYTATRTVYWASSAHVAVAPELTITEPGSPDTVTASAGSYLAESYGPGYVAVGFTFDHGTYRTDDGTTIELAPASESWFEQPLSAVRADRFVLRLDGEIFADIGAWLDAPLLTRGRPEHASRSEASGGTLREWFDVIVHTQEITPAEPL